MTTTITPQIIDAYDNDGAVIVRNVLPPAWIERMRRAIDDGQLQCFTDEDCLAELERVTGYPAFALDDDGRRALLASYLRFVQRCDAAGEEDYRLPRCRDQDDQKFLILAARCRADLLITRDKLLLRLNRHRTLPPACPIATAQAACERLALV